MCAVNEHLNFHGRRIFHKGCNLGKRHFTGDYKARETKLGESSAVRGRHKGGLCAGVERCVGIALFDESGNAEIRHDNSIRTGVSLTAQENFKESEYLIIFAVAYTGVDSDMSRRTAVVTQLYCIANGAVGEIFRPHSIGEGGVTEIYRIRTACKSRTKTFF